MRVRNRRQRGLQVGGVVMGARSRGRGRRGVRMRDGGWRGIG